MVTIAVTITGTEVIGITAKTTVTITVAGTAAIAFTTSHRTKASAIAVGALVTINYYFLIIINMRGSQSFCSIQVHCLTVALLCTHLFYPMRCYTSSVSRSDTCHFCPHGLLLMLHHL
jgi:hypothetical protein